MIPFNKPYIHGRELLYIANSVASGKISGDGIFTKKCHDFLENRYGFKKALLTTSCTDALEMAAILLDIGPGDEVIAPAYTFVSSVNAFILRGAKIAFADSCKDNPNIDPLEVARLITSKTKAIVVVHYAGVPCDMDAIMEIADKHNIPVVEDAAQAIDSYYKGRPLGSIGTFGTFSFHETKNIISGEGGCLSVNDERYFSRAEVIREKGTNRSSFFRGEVNKYGWVDIGSSFLPSDIIAAYLYAQLEILDDIQSRRKSIWNRYYDNLFDKFKEGCFGLPEGVCKVNNNAHMFYIECKNADERSGLITYLKENGVNAVFHYLPLHKSEFYKLKYDGPELANCDRFSDTIVRLPFFYELKDHEIDVISDLILKFYR